MDHATFWSNALSVKNLSKTKMFDLHISNLCIINMNVCTYYLHITVMALFPVCCCTSSNSFVTANKAFVLVGASRGAQSM